MCPSCSGSGLNPEDKSDFGIAGVALASNVEGTENEMSGKVQEEKVILSFSNKAEPWRFDKGMPCWVCLGKKARFRTEVVAHVDTRDGGRTCRGFRRGDRQRLT